MSYDAVVLAGGEGRRLGRVSKPALSVGGRRLLDVALDAVAGAARTIVVGAKLPTSRLVEWAREEPIGGGPLAALAAAMPLVRSPVTVVLAADLPFITADAIAVLRETRGDAAAAIAIDDSGRDQPLVGCYATASLRTALPADPNGASMRSLLQAIEAVGPIVRVVLAGDPPVTWDCDTPADLHRAQELA
jgi:molybdopterin-guanine dinucleotide biosynthesis protein A